ncbi:MAG TPA: hypothetical protein VF796_29985 [Humisphaera sp.]
MGTRVVSVACNHCGATLDVGGDTRFVTCQYCGSRLAVHRTGSAAYTEVLDELRQATRRLSDDVGTIKLQNELEALDREWAMRRDELMVDDGKGRRSVPTRVGATVAGAATVVFGVFWTVMAANMEAGPIFFVFGVGFTLLGIVSAMRSATKAGEYEQAEQAYRRRRAELIRRLDADPSRPG